MKNLFNHAVIEIPANTNYKYEIDKENGVLVLDRVIRINVPFNYGYVPATLSEDGDPIDIFVISRGQIFPKANVKFKLFGVFKCTDGGLEDTKLIGFLEGEEDLESEKLQIFNHIEYYLKNYKEGFEVLGYGDEVEAQELLDKAATRYLSGFYVPESIL